MKRYLAGLLIVLGLAFSASAEVIRGVDVPPKRFKHQVRNAPTGGVTEVTAKDTWVTQVIISNRTGSAITYTLEDKQATPYEFFENVSIAANSINVVAFEDPVLFDDGIGHGASVTGLNVTILGWQSAQ